MKKLFQIVQETEKQQRQEPSGDKTHRKRVQTTATGAEQRARKLRANAQNAQPRDTKPQRGVGQTRARSAQVPIAS